MLNSAIHYKLDWFTAMFEQCSIFDVLDLIGIDLGFDVLSVYKNHYLSSKGYGTDITFDFDGINIKTDFNYCYRTFHTDDLDRINADDFFSAVFSKIRLDLSGKALDQLRNLGLDVDHYFTVPFDISYPKSYHITRCDFAFDLVNYAPDFLDKCIFACNNYSTHSGRLFTSSGGVGMKYSLRLGDQRTLYIGSPRSDQLLRIYDKRLQFEQGNRLASDCPYNVDGVVPESWIRIELQTRNEVAQGVLYGHRDPLSIFKFIYDKFAIKKSRGLLAEICDEWVNLYDWEKIPRIIQNAKSIQYETVRERAEKYCYNIAFSNLCVCFANYGLSFAESLACEFERLQTSNNPLDKRRFASIFLKIMYSNGNDSESPSHLGYDSERGVYSFTL